MSILDQQRKITWIRLSTNMLY